MYPFSAFELAEIRQAELLEQAEHFRLVRQSAGSRSGRPPRWRPLQRELMALRALIRTMRRTELTLPTDAAPAAVEPA